MALLGGRLAWHNPLVLQVLAGCALLLVCVLFQPKHKEVELFQRRAAARALRVDALKNKATLQALKVEIVIWGVNVCWRRPAATFADGMMWQADVVSDGWGDDQMDEDAPPPEDIMALQSAQAGSILGLDYMEATAAGAAATAAAAGPELIPLLALRQRYNAPREQLRTVNAPFRLSGYSPHPYDASQPSADPWTGNPDLASVHQEQPTQRGASKLPGAGESEADYAASRSAAQQAGAVVSAHKAHKPAARRSRASDSAAGAQGTVHHAQKQLRRTHASAPISHPRAQPRRIRLVAPRALYEYHVPGDYLGGDGGMDSDYDDVIAPSEFFGTDEKGDAPFGDLRGFGPADRAPIYQVTPPCFLSLASSPLLPLPCFLSLASSPLLPLPLCACARACAKPGVLAGWRWS
jgi:hypothetical protein